jgi:protein-S-isoprenylcysteine O-methyltransferase Ste14
MAWPDRKDPCVDLKTVFRWLDLAVYLAFLAFAAAVGPHATPWYVGLCLAAATMPFWFAARWQLGASFSATAQARHLVTEGLYSKLRHPVYYFGSVAWLGALMALLGWRAVIIWVIVAAIEFARARHEERVLAEAFGAEYEEYRTKTWF